MSLNLKLLKVRRQTPNTVASVSNKTILHLIAENSAAMNTTEQKKGWSWWQIWLWRHRGAVRRDSLGRWQNDGRPQI